MDNIQTATPVEIDTRLAEIYSQVAMLRGQREQAETTVERIDNLRADSYERDFKWNSPAKREEAAQVIVSTTEKIQGLFAEALPMEARFKAERWTRYYWVTNTGGHIHFTTGCDSCFPTTSFAWMTEYSGMAHADLVEVAGSTACTVCFPDAPVETLRRKTTMELPDRKAAREAREAKQAEAAAKAVDVSGYHDYHRVVTKTFKTERAATNDIAGSLRSLCWYGTEHPSAQEWISNIHAIREALTTKGVDYDYDKALTAARKSVSREGSTPKF